VCGGENELPPSVDEAAFVTAALVALGGS